jgi:RHS repeat-associated protein
MPAKLPPNSGYTYCVELGVDGLERVRFDKPVVMWVDNFLGFDVGEIVPVGYYDRDRGVWVPADNGRVVELLAFFNEEGLVDSLDANGDGEPDDLNDNGDFSDEVTGLTDPVKYPVGSTFWRFAVTHFTPWDCNWPYGPPPDAVPPNPEELPLVDQQQNREREKPRCIASFVEDRTRILHEDIPIPGTDMTLHYASNRVEGYKSGILVPVSGETVPASLKRIFVRVYVAGRLFKQVLDPLPNQKVEFIWDGLDHLDRPVSGPTTAQIRIGFEYDSVYYGAREDVGRAFAQAGSEVTGVRGRSEIISWVNFRKIISPSNKIVPRGKGLVAEGWTLSSHHYFSPADRSTLYKGDGTTTNNIDFDYKYKFADMASTEQGFAGNGSGGFSGDEGPAAEAQIDYPMGLASDASGNLYFADRWNYRVRKVDTNGIISTVAGNGDGWWYSGDGGPAIETSLFGPRDVAVDAYGNIYILDYEAEGGSGAIRKVDTNGIITTVGGSSYDMGPGGIALDPSGNVYVGDNRRDRVLKVDVNGDTSTIVGNGTSGYSGDGGPATLAQIRTPVSIAMDPYGNLYIADVGCHCIRKVETSGIITTVAGNGESGYSGDGGPAKDALLNTPTDVTVDEMGNLYIVDRGNNKIRKVNTNGVITTTAILVSDIREVAVNPSGKLYITDSDSNIISEVGPLVPYVFLKRVNAMVFTEGSGLGHVVSESGRHLKTVDLDTGVVLYQFGYDQEGSLASITDQFGNQTTIERDGSGVPTAIISPDGITTNLTIDSNNHLTQITYPDGSHYDFEYAPEGFPTAKVEPEGNRFEHRFDFGGRLTDIIDPEGGNWQFYNITDMSGNILTEVRTGEGNTTSYLDKANPDLTYTSTITDPSGAETVFHQDASRLTVRESLPCGMERYSVYNVDTGYKSKYLKEITESTPSGLERTTEKAKTYADTDSDDVPDLITKWVIVNDRTTTHETNVIQSKKTITSPEGRTVTTLYDSDKLLTTSFTMSGLFDTTYGYDLRGRLTSITTNTRQTALAYNTQGFLESIKDPENHTTSYTYDAVARMTGISRPDGSSLGFAYDKNGNMTVLTNPANVAHTFGFDNVNLNRSYQTPSSGSYSYVYDKDRRLKEINFPSGLQISNIYGNGRLTQIRNPEGIIDLNYLCGSKVGSITNGTDTITYGYDGSLVTSETLSGTLAQSLSFTYNNDFNLDSFTYAGGITDYAYDNDGLLTGAGFFTITRNAGNGLPESVTDGTLNLTRSFNGYGEVSGENYKHGSNTLISWTLTHDDNGRIIEKTETVSGTPSNYEYTYDAMGRLLTVTKDSNLVEEYQYDIVGTRTYEVNTLRGISGRGLAYSNEDHLLTAGGAIYEYDEDGFLISKTHGTDVTSYDYSSRGELLGATLPDLRMIDYVYDPLGRRIAKKINGSVVEEYLWQGLTRLLAVYDGSDNLIMRFEYADGRVPIAMTRDGSTYYLTYDQVGSLRVISDSSGNVVKKIDYDSFGNIIADTDPSLDVPFGFAGGFHDRDTNLVRFGYRDYDPDIGRWTAKDPILFAGGDTDLYGYCLNDPVSFVDRLGLLFERGDVVSLGVTGTITTAKVVGLITAGAAYAIGGASIVLGVFALPSDLYAFEELDLYLRQVEQERLELEKRIEELERKYEPMFKKFHVDSSPCP